MQHGSAWRTARSTTAAWTVGLCFVFGVALTQVVQASEHRLSAEKRKPVPAVQHVEKGHRAARSGRWKQALKEFRTALRDDLKNPRLHFLNALAYDQLGRGGERDYVDLARVGYQNATRFGARHFWARLYLGYLELDRDNFVEAQIAFAAAVRDAPQRWEAFYGLGVASYYSGDVLTARLAPERCRELAPGDPRVLRLDVFSKAAAAEPDAVYAAERYLEVEPKPTSPYLLQRVSDVLRDTRLAQLEVPTDEPEYRDPTPDLSDALAQNQILVDVTIILSSLLDTETRGINLFDGLAVQYAYSNIYSSNRDSGSPKTTNRSITSSISVPQLTYSLDLFNDSGQHYQVLARPSLTAYLGRESEFFAGRTINVEVSGINLGTLQPIDVGVSLKVTPEVIEGRTVTFQIAASRSFLSREEVGTFDQSLTTFKQLVSATAQVDFGQTLLLSALSETVRDAAFSRVPVLGSIPVVSLLFRRQADNTRRESLIVLLTPTQPTAIQTADRLRPEAVDALIDTWQNVVEPTSSIERILERINRSRFFQATESGDLKWSNVVDLELIEEALRENAELASS